VLVHVVNGDSADALGDFTAINQELQLFNPQLAQKAQVVVVNKIDIPAVREALPGLAARLRQAAGHSRVMGISAATGENVRELLRRVHKLVRAVERDGEGAHVKAAGTSTGSVLGQGAPAAAGLELGGAAEEVVSYAEDGADRSFEVLTDDSHPGQFRVQGKHIEKVRIAAL
jgi:GTP-binding protein